MLAEIPRVCQPPGDRLDACQNQFAKLIRQGRFSAFVPDQIPLRLRLVNWQAGSRQTGAVSLSNSCMNSVSIVTSPHPSVRPAAREILLQPASGAGGGIFRQIVQRKKALLLDLGIWTVVLIL